MTGVLSENAKNTLLYPCVSKPVKNIIYKYVFLLMKIKMSVIILRFIIF